jgi:hypothetical protein
VIGISTAFAKHVQPQAASDLIIGPTMINT